MKICGACKKEKDSSEFHKRAASKDGLAARCRSCQREYDKARLKDPKRMEMRREYQRTEIGKAAHRAATKRWVDRNAIKRAVHIITGNAIRSGVLTKMPCEICGCSTVHAHHDDYAHPLTVRWLCDNHHNEWHRENGEGANAS